LCHSLVHSVRYSTIVNHPYYSIFKIKKEKPPGKAARVVELKLKRKKSVSISVPPLNILSEFPF